MATSTYLIVMLVVILAVTAFAVPSLFRRRCPACRARNALDAAVCCQCGASLQEEDRNSEEQAGGR